MTYKLLRQDCHRDSWSILCVDGIDGIAVHTLNRGAPIPEPAGLVRVTLSALQQQTCDFLESPCPIVSNRMRGAFERAGVDNVQWFPAELEVEVFKTVHRGFWAMNVIGKLACVDMLASDVEEDDDGMAIELRSFHIDPDRTYGMSMFRLAEDLRAIVIGERLQGVLRDADLQGVVFQDPRAYNRGLPVVGIDSPEYGYDEE